MLLGNAAREANEQATGNKQDRREERVEHSQQKNMPAHFAKRIINYYQRVVECTRVEEARGVDATSALLSFAASTSLLAWYLFGILLSFVLPTGHGITTKTSR